MRRSIVVLISICWLGVASAQVVEKRDEVCDLPNLPIEGRLHNRNFPSILGFGEMPNHPTLSRDDQTALHDLVWFTGWFRLNWINTPQGYKLAGDMAASKADRDAFLAKNPNMLIIAEVPHRDAILDHTYPEDWFGWIRDEHGNLVPASIHGGENVFNHFLVDFTRPAVQDIIVQKAVALANCGLFDGMFTEWWIEKGYTLAEWGNWSKGYSTPEAELAARLSIIQRIRALVPKDFLIFVNVNRRKLPLTAQYINGAFMEILLDNDSGYTRAGIMEIEDSVIWHESNLREPRITLPRGAGIPTEPPDSPTNRRWMRVFTTLTLTLTDGYALYTHGAWFNDHIWYDFWDADLGQPIGLKAQNYQDIEGLYSREFTKGWAVYNRSGKARTISLPSSAFPVSDRAAHESSITHQLPDLDGEIYLKTWVFYDQNGDGVLNILDLIVVSESFGTSRGDVNGDGETNILDLTLLAQHLN